MFHVTGEISRAQPNDRGTPLNNILFLGRGRYVVVS
jgi:hypothetical protein